jgi:hypothetical protein
VERPAHAPGLEVVAEGVETAEQRALRVEPGSAAAGAIPDNRGFEPGCGPAPWRRRCRSCVRHPPKPHPTMAQYVFTMNRVGKIVPPKRQILKNITLSFFPGAKIGVLGVNGSG